MGRPRKLSAEQVESIRRQWLAGDTYASLATEYGLSVSACSDIVRGITYRELPGIPTKGQRRDRNRQARVVA